MALVAVALFLGGCNIAAMAALMGYDPHADAEYKLTKGSLLLVAEDFAGAGGDPTIRYHLVNAIREPLEKKKVNTQIIPDKDLWDLQRSRPVSAQWDERRLGKELGAEQVVHVQMEPYVAPRHSPDPTQHARLSCSVRVIDVKTGDQVWPLQTEGREVVFELPPADMHGMSPGEDLKRSLAKGLGDQVAKLFFKHKLTDREASQRAAREKGMR